MKRKIISVLTAVLILASVCSICFADGYAFMISSKSDAYSVAKGDTFSVSFYANSITDSKGILAITAHAKYDPSQLRYKGIKGLVPENWGMMFFCEAFEAVEGSEKLITINMAYDGNTGWDSIAVNEDNKLGFELTFEVVTAAKGTASVSVLTDGLEATALSDLSAVYGLGDTYTLFLNEVQTVVSEESSYDPFYSIDDTVSYEEVVSFVEESSEEPSSEEISEESSSEEIVEIVSEESSVNASEIVEESIEESIEQSVESVESVEESVDESVAASEISEESEADEEGGLGVIFWIIIACVAVSAIAVVVYIKKFKKDDMNPVNPG